MWTDGATQVRPPVVNLSAYDLDYAGYIPECRANTKACVTLPMTLCIS